MISHNHKCIFVHVPKCGGTSVEQATINDLGTYTTHTKRALLLQRNVEPEAGPPCLAHMGIMDYLNFGHVPRWQFDEYYKFAIVRNPFHRVASFYRYLQADKTMSFRDFVLKQFSVELQARFWMVKPAWQYLTGPDNALAVDDVFKLEDIDQAWRVIQRKTGIVTDLGHELRQLPVLDYRDLYQSSDLVNRVRVLYAEDFFQFGYEGP